VKAFFGAYKLACKAADELLFSVGDLQRISESCKDAQCGKLTREALYVHESGLENLPAILRVYEGCTRAYIGAVEGANLVKLCRQKPQISYLSYPDFEKDPHPALAGSLAIPLHNFRVKYRDYGKSENPPILHRKETLVPASHPCREKFERLTKQEERLGLLETPKTIGYRRGWSERLAEVGVTLRGHRVIRRK